MKKLLLAGISFAALVAGPTMAADLARPAYVPPVPVVYAPVWSWTGFYVGANAGYAWGRSDLNSFIVCPDGIGSGTCPISQASNLSNIASGASGSATANGFTGGIQAGYNWQIGALVLGAELDFNSFHLRWAPSLGPSERLS
jgi:outer membrane immunogenic protein